MVGQRGAHSGLVFSNCFCSAFTVIQKRIERVTLLWPEKLRQEDTPSCGRPLCLVYRIVCLLRSTGDMYSYDHPHHRSLVLPDRDPAGPISDVVHLGLLASTRAQVPLRLVLEGMASHAVVSATLVFNDLQVS